MFEKQWALSLLEQVLSRFHTEMIADGKSALFEAVKDTLTGVRSTTYAAIGAELNMCAGPATLYHAIGWVRGRIDPPPQRGRIKSMDQHTGV